MVIVFSSVAVHEKFVVAVRDTEYSPAVAYVCCGFLITAVFCGLPVSPKFHAHEEILLSIGLSVVLEKFVALPLHENGGASVMKFTWGCE